MEKQKFNPIILKIFMVNDFSKIDKTMDIFLQEFAEKE
jgi:hypothetical protein